MQVAQLINIMLLTLVTGVFWGTWFSLSRTIESITPGTFLEVGKTMIVNLGGPMRILMPLALLSTLPVLYLMYRQGRWQAFLLVTIGLLCFVVALIGTLTVNVPIDGQINDWTFAKLPPDWMQIRDRWELWHTIRTFASLTGLAFISAGAIQSGAIQSVDLSRASQSKRSPEPTGAFTAYESPSAPGA